MSVITCFGEPARRMHQSLTHCSCCLNERMQREKVAMTILITYEDYSCVENFKPLGRHEEASK